MPHFCRHGIDRLRVRSCNGSWAIGVALLLSNGLGVKDHRPTDRCHYERGVVPTGGVRTGFLGIAPLGHATMMGASSRTCCTRRPSIRTRGSDAVPLALLGRNIRDSKGCKGDVKQQIAKKQRTCAISSHNRNLIDAGIPKIKLAWPQRWRVGLPPFQGVEHQDPFREANRFRLGT